jgi:hypothetical protein
VTRCADPRVAQVGPELWAAAKAFEVPPSQTAYLATGRKAAYTVGLQMLRPVAHGQWSQVSGYAINPKDLSKVNGHWKGVGSGHLRCALGACSLCVDFRTSLVANLACGLLCAGCSARTRAGSTSTTSSPSRSS